MDAMRAGWAILTLVAALTSACVDEGRTCYPGDWRACTCADGSAGYQRCGPDGAAYGACDCSGTIPGLTTSASTGAGAGGSVDAGAGGADGGTKLPFLSECTLDEECESGLCFPFNAKGPHCTIPCGPDTTCPPPSPGCNQMGVCKVP